VEVETDVAVALANAGLLQIIQRSPASKAEKSMANDGKGYENRPKDFVRSSIPFSDENAATLSKFLGETIEVAEGIEITPVVTAKEHVIGATKEPAYAEEKRIVQKHIDSGTKMVSWATDKIGYLGGGDLTPDNVELLKAVKAFKAKLIAEAV
jgi:hypothetical protein